MGTFLFSVIAIWAVCMVIWWAVSRAARSKDVDRIKSRVVGTNTEAKSKSTGVSPALFQGESQTGALTQRMLKTSSILPKFQELLDQAGLKWEPVRFAWGIAGMFLAGFAVGWFFLPPAVHLLGSFLLGILGAVLPYLYVRRAKKLRLRRFEELFPDSLEFVSRSMRAGHAFSVSLEMIHREFQEPLAGEFRRTFDEHNLGLPLDFALQKLAKRVPSLDVHFFVSAVLLQKRTGGNLAEILDKLAYVIRERFKLRGKIRSISAHGKMTATALSCIPLAVAVLMFFVNPDYVRFFFTDDVGVWMLAGAVALQVTGYLIMKKIVNIEV